MDKLYVILINDNVIRTTLADFRELTGAQLWLVTSPHYFRRLTAEHREVFAKILVQEDFETKALIETLAPQLPERLPPVLKFLSNDESCELACAELAEHFGRPARPAAQMLPFVNKMATKSALDGRVRLPRHVQFDRARFIAEGRGYCEAIVAEVGLPLVVKPIDRYASMDVRRLDSLAELRAWASWACSPKDRNVYEIDEFLTGTLFNCDSLVQHGEVIWSSVCRNLNPCMEFAQGRTIGVHTVPIDDPVAVRVRELSAKALAAMIPPDGGIHMEIFLTPADELVFLEVGARPPGGELRDIYLRTWGFDIDLAHYMLRAGEEYRFEGAPTGWYGGWSISPRFKGTVAALNPPGLRSEHTADFKVAVGETVERHSAHIVEPPSVICMIYHTDYAEFDRDMDLLREYTAYRVED